MMIMMTLLCHFTTPEANTKPYILHLSKCNFSSPVTKSANAVPSCVFHGGCCTVGCTYTSLNSYYGLYVRRSHHQWRIYREASRLRHPHLWATDTTPLLTLMLANAKF